MASPNLDHPSKSMVTGVSDLSREEVRSKEGFRGILHESRHHPISHGSSGPDRITHTTNPITMSRPLSSSSPSAAAAASATDEGKANLGPDVAKSPPIHGVRPLGFTALNQPFSHGGPSRLGTSLPPFTTPTAYQSSISTALFPPSSDLPAPNHTSPPEPRHRIPSIQSTSPRMPPVGLLSSNARATSPSPASSARLDYTTSTPHVGRHIPPRASVDHTLSPKSSSVAPARRSGSPSISPSISSSSLSPRTGSSSMAMDPAASPVPALQPASPPLNETELFHQIVSSEGSPVRPEIHARVDKGFFLSERDWTCYRRNYFSVVCSYSLLPSNFPAPLFLRRSSGNGQAEQILGFAVKISAAVHGVAGKPVELVQHTPKRDKGPQLQPSLIKLNPQPVGGGSVPNIHGQSRSMEYDYGYPPSHHMAQQQHVALYDRIQFKSATANNGKRRAAQQYYNLIVELYADVGATASHAIPHSGDNGWVKIAHRVSAPMVVRGRSPGHYIDEQRKARPSSAGPESGNGNNQPPTPGPHHYQPSSLLPHDPHGYFPHKHSLGSSSSDPHEHLLNPVISDADHQALNPDMPYSYFPAPLSTLDLSHHHASQQFNGFFEPLHADRSLYPPPSASRSRYSREELNAHAQPSWIGGSREEQRIENLRKCERFHSSDSSSPYYPPPNTLRSDLLL